MAVNTTSSGGIYIEISGNYSQFEADLRAVRQLARTAGSELSKSLGVPIDHKPINDLTQSLMKAQAASKTMAVDLKSQESAIREWGEAVGIVGKQLDSYVALQSKAFKSQAAKEFASQMREIQRVSGATDKEMQALAESLGGTFEAFTKASRSTNDLGSCLKSFGIQAYAAKKALDVISSAGEALKNSFDLAARYETLGVAMQQVGKTAGYSALEIDKSANALRRQGIAGIEARQGVAQLVQAQVDLSKSTKLARIAQDAAVFGGLNSSQAFEKLVHGIQSAQTEVLRTIGINVNFEQSYAKLATQLGKTKDALTEQEKVQARINAVMESGEGIAGAYEAAMGTVGKQTSSMARIQQDALSDIGALSLEFIKATGIVGAYATTLETVSSIAVGARASLLGLSQAEIMKALAEGGTPALRELTENMAAVKDEGAKLDAMLKALSTKGVDVSGIAEPFNAARKEFFDARTELKLLEDRLVQATTYNYPTGDLIKKIDEVKKKIENSTLSVVGFREKIASLFSAAKDIATGSKSDASAQDFEKKTKDQLAQVEAAFAKTDEQSKRLKIASLKNLQEIVNAQVAAGKYTAEEGAKRNAAFAKEIETLNKGTSTAADKASKNLEAYDADLTKTKNSIAALQAQLATGKTDVFTREQIQITQKYDAAMRDIEKTFKTYTTDHKGVTKTQAEDLEQKKKLEAANQRDLDLKEAQAKQDQRLAQTAQAKYQFYQELEQMSGQYGLSVEIQNALLEEQAKRLNDLEIPQQYIDQWKELKKLQTSREGIDGARRAYIKYMAEATDQAKQMEKIYTDLFTGIDSGMKSMWEDFLDDGKVSMSSLRDTFKKFLSDLAYMAVMQPITLQLTGAIASSMGIAGGGGNILSGLLGSVSNAGTGNNLFNLGNAASSAINLGSTASGWLGTGNTMGSSFGSGLSEAQVFGEGWGNAGNIGNSGWSTALGYLGAGLAGYFGGQSFYSGIGSKWGLPQGRETGWTSGVGGALGAIGATSLMSSSIGAALTSAAVGGATSLGGATAGAAAGSVVPVLGTAIGAAIGAIAGGLLGSLGGKERQTQIYGAMRTNLVDPAAYTEELALQENSQALADAFGDTARNLSGDWNAIDLKGTTGHSAYYVDPVHAGGSSRKIASSLEPAMLEMETMVLEIANTIRESLPTDELKKSLDAYNQANALVLEYKTKGGNLNEEGMEYWANYWAEQTQEHLLKALSTLDWSEYEGKIKVDTSTWEGYERFLAGTQAIENVKTATEELINPTSEWITQAKAANAQLDEWAYALRQYGVEAEYATQLMDEYRAASVGEYVKALQDAVTPASQLSQAMKALEDDMNGRIEGLKILGATEAQVAQATVVMNQALADLRASLAEPFYNDLRTRALTVAGGDVAGEQLRQSHVSQRVSAIATFGEDSAEYANLLAVQQAEAMKHQADLAQAEYERLAASLDSLAQTAGQTAANVESARLALVTELVNAELTARNGIKEAVDAWADAAQSAFDTAGNAYLSALQTSLSTFQAIAGQMRSLQQSLWTSTSYTSQDSVYASSRSELDRLYALAAGGDKDAASSFTSMAKTYLDASKTTATDFSAYQDDFYAVQGMIASLENDANSQAASLQSEVDLLTEQLGLQSKANKTLDELRDEMESARAVMDRALTEQAAAYDRWGFEAVVPGIEGLELAYREAVDTWIAADEALNNALLSGLTTQMEIDSLRISSSLDALMQAYRDAEAASAAAQAEYASASYQSMSALEQARQKAESLAQQALDLAAKAQAQIAATGGFAGSRYATEHELLQAKANEMNAGRTLAEGQTAGGWTVTNLKDYILNTAGLSVAGWYEKYGKLEGFASGGLATPGWAMVGEHGPELVNFASRAMVYPAGETERILSQLSMPAMITPAASDGSDAANRAMLRELQDQNATLKALLYRMANVDKNTKDGADTLSAMREDEIASGLSGGTTRRTEWLPDASDSTQ